MTQIYHENYPEHERGKIFSRTVMIRIAAVGIFSFAAGRLLSDHMQRFQILLVVFAAAFVLSAWCIRACPSQPLVAEGGTHPFRSLRYARDDALFRQTLISWMLLGFGNLMMVPLRVEMLANPVHGWTLHGAPLTAVMIAVMTGVVPNAARLLLNPFWGWAFDRMNFFALRITLNVGFVLGILAFFTSGSLAGLVLGAVLYGISHAGGDVAWSLWVTKFAPPGRVADYMSVHTFFTGVRGVIAPIVAFQLMNFLSVGTMAWISVGFILAGTAILFPELWSRRASRAGAVLTEEVSE
jgi:hypothetical protein